MTSTKIFIVDDNSHLLEYLEKFLQDSGYEVRTASNGLSAVEVLSEYHADFIFIDYFLPHINADRLCQIIRKMEHLKNAFLIIVSAAASELSLKSEDIQADAIIAKGTFKETAASLLNALKNADKRQFIKENTNATGIKKTILPRRMTRELLDQNSHLRAMLDSISEGILEVYRGKIVYANPASEKLLEKPQVKMLAEYFPDLFDDESRIQAEKLMKVCKPGITEEVKETIKYRDKTLLCNVYPLEKDDDTIIILITDITALKRAEENLNEYQHHLENLVEKRTLELELANEKLMHAQKMEVIGTIAGGVAHDLNNILSGIVSYPDLLLMELPNNSPFRRPIETIKRSGEKAAAIVQDLLTLARRGAIRDSELCVNEVVQKCLESSEHQRIMSYHRNIEIVKSLDSGLMNIKGSFIHISTLLMNLIKNAAEAMPYGGAIRISTENLYVDNRTGFGTKIPPGDYILLKVEDEGVGMSENDIKHIFEPFYTKKNMGISGTGLGMTVVWGTVKDHRGYIEIDSKKGRGTVISVYFPAAE